MRKIIKSSKREVKGFKEVSAWGDSSKLMFKFTGRVSKSETALLVKALIKILGQQCVGGLYPSDWNLDRVFQFNQTGVVVVRCTSYQIH